ncbi:probable ATP-dependent RNA helicase YfmL [Zophobas morio]|uniref:probable ATP-dependent RNA helicase YfmL n=1 Tax=Zophobas morio TaxID=2755281 RepID=UPI003083D078
MATVILLKSNFSLSRQANMPRKLITRKWLDACTSGKSKTTTEDNREDSHTIKLKNEKAYSRASKVIESIKNSSDSRSDVITKPKFSQDFLPVVESSTKENSVGTGLYIDEDLEGLNPQERKGLEDFRKEIKASLTPTKSEVYRNLLSTVKASNFTDSSYEKLFKNLRPEISVPTPVQNAAIPPIGAGLDVFIQAQSGTGKTLAYLLPLVQNIRRNGNPLSGIIFVPLQELAYQVCAEIKFLNKSSDFVGLAISSRDDILSIEEDAELDKKRLPSILVATPTYFLKLLTIKKRFPHFRNIRHVVVDEADLQFPFRKSYDTQKQREKRLKHLKPITQIFDTFKKASLQFQCIIVSAALNSSLRYDLLKQEVVKNPLIIRDSKFKIPEEIIHEYASCAEEDKLKELSKIIKSRKAEKGLIILHDEASLQQFSSMLYKETGVDCCLLHELIIKRGLSGLDFMSNVVEDARFYVARERAAYGLDIRSLKEVYIMNLPEKPSGYMHICGRAGTVGQKGRVTSILTGRETYHLHKYSKYLNFHSPRPWTNEPIECSPEQ